MFVALDLQDGPPKIAKLRCKWLYGRYNYSYWGLSWFINQLLSGGAHPVGNHFFLRNPPFLVADAWPCQAQPSPRTREAGRLGAGLLGPAPVASMELCSGPMWDIRVSMVEILINPCFFFGCSEKMDIIPSYNDGCFWIS